jgi:GNAT superfamily N-acetyltransferase
VTIQPIDRAHAPQALTLLRDLNVSLYGSQSPAIHAALVQDGINHRIDFRIALEGEGVLGLVLAAPASYQWAFLIRHWLIALRCVTSRAAERLTPARPHHLVAVPRRSAAAVEPSTPPRSWNEPGDAWRIVFVGTAPRARGRGVAARLYEAVMAERSLVARIAKENAASLRLHQSLGWRLFADGKVVLAVHLRGGPNRERDYRAPEARSASG